MSFILNCCKLKKVELTKEPFEKHRVELLDMLVDQYFRKDSSCFSLAYVTLYHYFEEEYDEIYKTDKSYKACFLYYDEDGSFVVNFVMRDAYISCKNHGKALEKMIPNDTNYDFDTIM